MVAFFKRIYQSLVKVYESIFGAKVGEARARPITLKILIVFTLFILVSSLSSNYLNLMYNRVELIKQMKLLLVKDLKSIYTFCNTQYEIYQYNNKLDSSVDAIERKAMSDFNRKMKKSVCLGIKSDRNFLFQASKLSKSKMFNDIATMEMLEKNRKDHITDGFIEFEYNEEEYYGIYKYNAQWGIYILRAEEMDEFYHESWMIFIRISAIIIFMTLVISIVGIFILQHMLRFIHIITRDIQEMIKDQRLKTIDLKDAPNDEITFLGMAFNALSDTIDNLVTMFRKFVNQDIVSKAYEEKEIRLEGNQKELTVLFSDIKSFTFITETLGPDIIKLLNLHYDNSIRQIIKHDGIVGAIIGDAILAVYGVMQEYTTNKSLQAVHSAYKLQELAKNLRNSMHAKKKEVIEKDGNLSSAEESVYKAVLLEIGVGIDGGDVFYGNIGSFVRMTNTVIGDNVNAASRLEGLTRIYKVPVICSEYVKIDIEDNVPNHGITFVEIDIVQVKGKTTGKRIYWPILEEYLSNKLEENIKLFSAGLTPYYKGKWKDAYNYFKKCKLPLAQEFRERTKSLRAPKNWNSIWEMKTK